MRSHFIQQCRVLSKIYLSSPPDDLTDEQTFKIFDKNGDGSISSGEMQSLMQSFGENFTVAEVNEVLKEADTSGDGRFTFEEFKAFMK